MTRLVTRPMLWRSVATSFIVGGVLFTVNHERAALAGAWGSVLWRQLGVSMAIPFAVSLASAVLARREMLAGATAGRDASS